MTYRILSPDGIWLCNDDPRVNTQAKVIDRIFMWAKRYENQGYYLTAEGERIHWLDLPYEMKIVRWGIRGKITNMRVARVGDEAYPQKLKEEGKYEKEIITKGFRSKAGI